MGLGAEKSNHASAIRRYLRWYTGHQFNERRKIRGSRVYTYALWVL